MGGRGEGSNEGGREGRGVRRREGGEGCNEGGREGRGVMKGEGRGEE